MTEITLLTADELGKMLKVSTRTVWRLLAKRELPEPVRVGGSTRWRLDEVLRWIEDGCPAKKWEKKETTDAPADASR